MLEEVHGKKVCGAGKFSPGAKQCMNRVRDKSSDNEDLLELACLKR